MVEKKPHPLNHQRMGLLVVYMRILQSKLPTFFYLVCSSLCNRISALGTELISSYKWSSAFAAYRLSRLLRLCRLALELSLLLRLHWLSLELSLLLRLHWLSLLLWLHWLSLELSLLLWLHWPSLELSRLLWRHWLSLELSLLWWYISIHVLLWHSLISIHHFLSD